jgi:hypothetical protein
MEINKNVKSTANCSAFSIANLYAKSVSFHLLYTERETVTNEWVAFNDLNKYFRRKHKKILSKEITKNKNVQR